MDKIDKNSELFRSKPVHSQKLGAKRGFFQSISVWRKRSMSTHSERSNPPTFEPGNGLKTAQKTEHIRSISLKTLKIARKNGACPFTCCENDFLGGQSHRKRSIAVQRGKNESLLSNDLRPKNGACPFTFSMKRQCASRKRSIAVHYSALSYVICMQKRS